MKFYRFLNYFSNLNMAILAYFKQASVKKQTTVQLKCNFTHVWLSTHGYTQIFACKIQKVAVEIVIFTRRGVERDVEPTRRGTPRDVKCHETYHVHTWRLVQTGIVRITTRNNNKH